MVISVLGLIASAVGIVTTSVTGVGFVLSMAGWKISAWALAWSVAGVADSC
jgi:hypothetical protein